MEISRFFKDKNGKFVLWQKPNLLISSWAILKIISWIITSESLKERLNGLGMAILFAWAYFEATKGVNYFRKTLGLIVLAVLTAGFLSM